METGTTPSAPNYGGLRRYLLRGGVQSSSVRRRTTNRSKNRFPGARVVSTVVTFNEGEC